MKFLGPGIVGVASLFLFACSQEAPVTAPKQPDDKESSVSFDAPSFFQNSCAPCHGPRGKGDGPARSTAIAPADLTSPKVQQKKSEELARIIADGTDKGMPPWEKVLSPADREALARFIKENLIKNQ